MFHFGKTEDISHRDTHTAPQPFNLYHCPPNHPVLLESHRTASHGRAWKALGPRARPEALRAIPSGARSRGRELPASLHLQGEAERSR